MATTKKATVASTNARVDALEAKLDTILAALTSDAAPAKPATKKAKAKTDAPRIMCAIPGKPSKSYVERDWVWIQWQDKPSQRTLDALKAGGWHYSVKRKAWHRVNTAD